MPMSKIKKKKKGTKEQSRVEAYWIRNMGPPPAEAPVYDISKNENLGPGHEKRTEFPGRGPER